MLIEYVTRIINGLKLINENELKPEWVNSVDRFIKHFVWHTPDLIST